MYLLPLVCLWLALVVAAPVQSAPTITWASDPVLPGETVLLLGEGWDEAPQIEVARLPDGPPGSPVLVATQPLPPAIRVAPLQVTPQSLKFVLPEKHKPGLFACRVLSGRQASDWVFLNAPDPWWLQGDQGPSASPGGWLRVFGKDLSLGQTTFCLRPSRGEPLFLPAEQADQWSARVSLAGLKPPATSREGSGAGVSFRVYLHNGSGGPAGWREVGTIAVRAPAPLWKSDRFSVTDFGAVPNDLQDDTAAVQAALQRAADNGGGIVYFPRGRYLVSDTLAVPPHTLLQGESRELTELYWPDRADPLPVLVRGSNSFSVQDLALYAVNHKHGITADLGSKPGAGRVWITRVRFRLNRFFHIKDNAEIDRRSRMATGDAIQAGGDDVRITDCEVYCSGRAIFLSKPRAAVVSGNTFYNGRGGWYCLSGCDGLVFENNRIIGGDHQATGGGINCLDGSTFSQNVYYAHNTLEQLYGWDREAMTSDAGGGAYIGGVTAAQETRLTLAQEAKWSGRNWAGAGVYILSGKGAGQYRRLVAQEGREVTVDRPWAIPPDETSVVSITMHQGHYLIIGNDFSDATIAVQFYGISIDHVVAGNRSARAGGFHNMGLNYYGFQPSWFVQYFDNAITEGNGYCGPLNETLPRDSSYFAYGGAHPEVKGPLARAAIFRRNRADNNARFQVLGATQDVIIENNDIKNTDVGVEIQATAGGVLLRGNRLQNVKEPYTGEGMGKAYLHPAERLGASLEAAQGLLPPGSESLRAAWKPLLRQMDVLAQRPADDPTVTTGVQSALSAALKEAGATDRRYGAEFIRVLLGLELSVAARPGLQQTLASAKGGEVQASVRATLAGWSLPLRLGYRLAPMAMMTAPAPEPAEPLAPGESRETTVGLNLPAGAWGPQSLLLFATVAGPDWRLLTAPEVTLGSGALRDWLVVGPFPNPSGSALDASYYAPEMRLDVAATYDSPAGKLAWKPLVLPGDRLDFKQVLAPGPGVAYAVAGLRAAADTRARLGVSSVAGCRAYLNDNLVLTNSAAGRGQTMVPLQAGDNILLLAVTGAAAEWNCSVEVAPLTPVAPGSLLPIPAAELASLPSLRPPPLPVVAGGEELPLSGGIAWKLLYSDDFQRGVVGPSWRVLSGSWTIKDGRLISSGAGLIVYARPVKAPYRLEYDVASPGPTDMASAWMRDGEGWAGGYYFGFGADGGNVNKLMKNGEYVATSQAPVPVRNRPYHVITQVLSDRVQLIIDGQVSIDFRERRPLTDPDTLGLYPWGDAWYDNVKIYTAGP